MLTWIAIIIAAFALAEILQVYLREKSEREFKQRHIDRRLNKIEERENEDSDERQNDVSSNRE